MWLIWGIPTKRNVCCVCRRSFVVFNRFEGLFRVYFCLFVLQILKMFKNINI